jgi:hypothetical protein
MATGVPGGFTRAAPGKSPGCTKPGAQWDSRRYQSPVTIAGAIGGNRLLITEYRLPFPAFPALLPPELCFLNFGYWLLAIFRATGLGQ